MRLHSRVLFDFDFTLADSTAGQQACVSYALQRLGLPPADTKAIRSCIGLSMAESLRLLTGVTDVDVVSEYTRLFVERADEVMAPLTTLFPEVPGVLRALRAKGLQMGIVSTKYRRRIEAILERDGLLGSFDVIVGGEDTDRHKPDPAALLLALELLDGDPATTVYVGDHPVDAQAAQAAGLPFVATLSGTHGGEAFSEFRPLAILDQLRELPTLLV